MGTQSRHPWKTSNMLLLAILLLGVGIQAAPQYKNQPKCSNQPKEECTTVYENVERKVTDVECHTEYEEECHTEYKEECHPEYTTECDKVPTTACENKPHDVCVDVVTKKTEKVPRKSCKTVQKKVCY